MTAPSPRPRTTLFVPVRRSAWGSSLSLFDDARGRRCVVGFTSPALLHAVLGEGRDHLELGRRAVELLAAPLGVTDVVVDPALAARPPLPLHDGWGRADPVPPPQVRRAPVATRASTG